MATNIRLATQLTTCLSHRSVLAKRLLQKMYYRNVIFINMTYI